MKKTITMLACILPVFLLAQFSVGVGIGAAKHAPTVNVVLNYGTANYGAYASMIAMTTSTEPAYFNSGVYVRHVFGKFSYSDGVLSYIPKSAILIGAGGSYKYFSSEQPQNNGWGINGVAAYERRVSDGVVLRAGIELLQKDYSIFAMIRVLL